MIDNFSLFLIALIGGGVLALLTTSLMRCHERGRLQQKISELNHLENQLERTIGLYEASFKHIRQSLTIWDTQTNQIRTAGMAPQGLKIPSTYAAFFDFASWLPPEEAKRLKIAIASLQEQAISFDLRLEVGSEQFVTARGQRVGMHILLAFGALSTQENDHLQQKIRANMLEARLGNLQMLLDEMKHPVWMREDNGTISWGNRAYFRISDKNYELLPHHIHEKISAAHARGEPYFDTVPAIIEGDRRTLDVSVIKGASGSVGIALDTTEITSLRIETRRIIADYHAIFDELPTAVAIFDARMQLEFFNQSFASLWPLNETFLESHPGHALLLERLRELKLLAESPDWRQWKEQLAQAWQAVEAQSHIWNLQDGRTLRVVSYPGPQGGVVWIYEDLSEKLKLEARYNTLIHMQGETLDHLHEGVALFGSDGRLQLANPAFARLWNLSPHLVIEGVHISQIEEFCQPQCTSTDWQTITANVTGFSEARETIQARIEHIDGRINNYVLVPLPQGQTMLSFVDVSDSVKVARALKERNEALESANRLRTDFVSHVSYELRTPLTNIMGFTDLLRSPAFGSLNERQHDYLNDIATQSTELLNLVNDILDLATVDAGIMQLDIDEVDISATLHAATARIEERLNVKNITLDVQIDEKAKSFRADEARMRQILFNLLANAANFAPNDSIITFHACAKDGEVIFQVHDEGAGIPDELLDKVFERFYTQAHHGVRPGIGLGLSIVKSFVELHQGKVEIETGRQNGTTITCHFPTDTLLLRVAAE